MTVQFQMHSQVSNVEFEEDFLSLKELDRTTELEALDKAKVGDSFVSNGMGMFVNWITDHKTSKRGWKVRMHSIVQ